MQSRLNGSFYFEPIDLSVNFKVYNFFSKGIKGRRQDEFQQRGNGEFAVAGEPEVRERAISPNHFNIWKRIFLHIDIYFREISRNGKGDPESSPVNASSEEDYNPHMHRQLAHATT